MTIQDSNRASGAAIAFIVGGVLFAILTVAAKLSIHAPDVDAARGTERSQALTQMRSFEYTNLTVVGWVDKSHGVVRLPIETALQKAEENWKNGADARADLKSREEKATAPVKPVSFE